MRKHMIRSLVLIVLVSLLGCSASRPVQHTERTRSKSEAEVKADFYDCRREWFGMGLIWIAIAAAVADAQTKECLEAKGYLVGEPPTQPVK